MTQSVIPAEAGIQNNMRLSLLQKYILKQCYLEGGKIKRDGLEKFYLLQKIAPQKSERVKIITQSLERLIERGMLVGFGIRTQEKWFIKEIRLTPKGKKETKRVLGEQQKLPLK